MSSMIDAALSSPLMDTFSISRLSSPDDSPALSPTRTEIDLPADVDESFNSSMSFSTCDSPPAPSPSMHLGKPKYDALYSPTPLALPANKRALMATKSLSSAVDGATLGAPFNRSLGPSPAFGRELSANVPRPNMFSQSSFKSRGRMLPPSVPEGKLVSPNRLHSTSSQENMRSPQVLMPRWGRRESEPAVESPYTRAAFSNMDIDSPAPAARASAFNSPATQMGSPDLEKFWCESPAAPIQPATKRRAPPSPGSPSSSPSTNRMRTDKAVSTTALSFSNWKSSAGAGQRRSAPYAARRPPLQPVQPVDGPRTLGTNSANPILTGQQLPQRLGPVRRANSMFCDQQMHDGSSDESEFEGSPCVNTSDIRRRYGRSQLPRVDGSPNKNRSSVPHAIKPARPLRAESTGLPGFGENEVQGKILPCHTSKEDGLVRITCETLRDVLDGRYDHKMKRYHIIDCRFDYEFEGGHIDGAINIRHPGELDSLLLSPNGGINAADGALPTPSTSGGVDGSQQVVLIFHCEFSKKRAPEVARELRTRDRKRNEGQWPQVHYPELYILEGGYCSFFKYCPTKCEPQAYREMEGHHLCDAKLSDFKKDFQRTRSLPAGEFNRVHKPLRGEQPPPPCGPLAFAAASLAAARRRGSEATGQAHGLDSSPIASDASPCPRSLFTGQAPLFGSVQSRTNNRAGFQRHASFAGTGVRR